MLTHNTTNDILTIHMAGHIDTAACGPLQNELVEILDKEAHSALIIDCTELTFIASSGLRIMLMVKKREKDMKVINVCADVYNVFDVTGFTKILTIEKALRKIDLSKCEMLGAGGMGAVYRISPEEIVKVNYNPATDKELDDELRKAKEAFILGIPTAISFDIVDCGEGHRGVVYETLKSKAIGELIEEDPSRMEELTRKYVALIKETHTVKGDPAIFGRAKDYWMWQAVEAGKEFEPEEAAILVEIANAFPERDTLVHGDAHPKNMMAHDGELMWIDMFMMGVGHPIFDIISASVLLAIRDEDRMKKLSGMSIANVHKMYPIFIREYFHVTTDEEVARYMGMLQVLMLVRAVFAIALRTENGQKVLPAIKALAREKFFPIKDQVIGVIQAMKDID